jgi:outer membrane cobalamin receptor
MKRLSFFSCCILLSSCAIAATITGKVVDPSDTGVSGARVVVTNRLGLLQQSTTDQAGNFRLDLSGAETGADIVVTAPGFARKTIALDSIDARKPLRVELEIAPISDSITVTGSAIPAPLSEQGSSVTVIPRAEIEQRNEATAVELLRFVPGLIVNQNGGRGGTASLFIRGGDSKYNLILIDGVPINMFSQGGFVDLAHIPTDFLDHIEVSRGPQSAVYGSYANSGVVNFVSRLDEGAPEISLIAEGGSHSTRRFAVGASGARGGYRASASASRLDTDGVVANNDYRDEFISLNVGKRFHGQDLSFRGAFNSSENGVPGPYGSNPVGNFRGLDRVSRNKNNNSNYSVHYEGDFSNRVRQEVFGTFFLGNNYYQSAFPSFNKDIRGTADARTTVNVSERYTLAFGAAYSREEVKNTYITDASFQFFPLHRNQTGIYVENRFRFGKRLYLNAGARTEVFKTPTIPAGSGRPIFPDHTMTQVNPKLAAGFAVSSSTRAHASFGTGIRPPGGFDLAFTDNPALKPERTIGMDAGVEQQLGGRLSVDATYFYNRYNDLIVSLGGSLARLGRYKTDNLANARSQGVEFSARFRPAARVSVVGAYTLLDTEVLSLDGASGVAQQFYRVGQELPRRPRHSGSIDVSYTHKRISANLLAYFRGKSLDVEPSFGAFGGFFKNPGYADLGVNLNYDLGRGVTIYGNLRNALNRKYEEIYGFPSLRLNFVAGIKWRLSREP